MVHVSVPPAPTVSVLQVQPPGNTLEKKVVFAGTVSVKLTLAALPGPRLITDCV